MHLTIQKSMTEGSAPVPSFCTRPMRISCSIANSAIRVPAAHSSVFLHLFFALISLSFVGRGFLTFFGFAQLMVTLDEDEFSRKNKLAFKLEQVYSIMGGDIDA